MPVKYASRMELIKPSAIYELLKHASDPSVLSFSGGFPDPTLFPIDQLEAVFTRVLRQQGSLALQYAGSDGLPALREKLTQRMRQAGVSCDLQQLILIQGAQQGLDLMAKIFIDPGDVIIVERPTFLGALIAFNPYQPRYACVAMDENGMDPSDLERILATTPGVKFIYTVPEFQNPTGITMPSERRRRLVELADRYDVMILEDSPYREIRYEGEAIPPIKSYDTQGRVVHLGSFSKILCPGLRQGWLVADEKLAKLFSQIKMAADTQNSTLNMYAINAYLEMYDIDAHIVGLRQAYKRKKDLMLDLMAETFPDSVSYTNPQGGLFTWLTMPAGADAARMMKERILPETRVAYVPGDEFYALDPESNHCRINYSYLPEDKMIAGVTRLGKILHEYFD